MKNNSLEQIYYNPTQWGRTKRRLLNLPEDTKESETAKFQTNIGDAAKRWNVTTMAPWSLAGGPTDSMSQKLVQDSWGMRQLTGYINNPLINVAQLVGTNVDRSNNMFAGTGGSIRNSISRAGPTLPFPKVNLDMKKYGDTQIGLYPFNLSLDPNDPLSVQFAHSIFQPESQLGIQGKILEQGKQFEHERKGLYGLYEEHNGLNPGHLMREFQRINQRPGQGGTDRFPDLGGPPPNARGGNTDDDEWDEGGGYGGGGAMLAAGNHTAPQPGVRGFGRSSGGQGWTDFEGGKKTSGWYGFEAAATANTDKFVAPRVPGAMQGSLGNASFSDRTDTFSSRNLNNAKFTNAKDLSAVSSATIKAGLAVSSWLDATPTSGVPASDGLFNTSRMINFQEGRTLYDSDYGELSMISNISSTLPSRSRSNRAKDELSSINSKLSKLDRSRSISDIPAPSAFTPSSDHTKVSQRQLNSVARGRYNETSTTTTGALHTRFVDTSSYSPELKAYVTSEVRKMRRTEAELAEKKRRDDLSTLSFLQHERNSNVSISGLETVAQMEAALEKSVKKRSGTGTSSSSSRLTDGQPRDRRGKYVKGQKFWVK
jgi:hypothetical protein